MTLRNVNMCCISLVLIKMKKIKSLYSNLDTISFWDIEDQIRLLEERGYSTREMETKLHRSLAFPFFLLSMILLSGVFTLGTNIKENNSTYIFLAIISCVIIYFFNDLSSVLGKTEKLPVNISVWMPIVIIFIFSTVATFSTRILGTEIFINFCSGENHVFYIAIVFIRASTEFS